MLDRSRFERELEELGLGAPRFGRGETTPKPIRVTHYHVRKAMVSRVLLSDTSPGVMTPDRMTPGYVAIAHPERQALQQALNKVISEDFASAISPKVRLRVALVDLTGAKGQEPVFAGFSAFGPGSGVEGASLTKILALYALYQLRFDLDTHARREGIDKAAALSASIQAQWRKEGLRSMPDLFTAMRFAEKAGSPVKATIRIPTDVHFDKNARAIILALGFEYIGSVALQSGLYHETYGGLWFNAAYLHPAEIWGASPFPALPGRNATALAAATFFTQLAQGRLVDQLTSNEIAAVLNQRQCMKDGLLDGITAPGIAKPVTNKCGLSAPYFHDAIHVVRQVLSGRRLEYVAAVLTDGLFEKKPLTFSYPALGAALDGLIAAANP